jgi:MFS family permease
VTTPQIVTTLTKPQRSRLLAVLFVVGVLNYADRTLLSVLLEPIKAEFKASDTALGLLTGVAFALFYATLGVPVARLSDRVNRPRIIAAMIAVWSLMSIMCGIAANFWQLALARIGVGAGEAGAVPASQGLIADAYPPGERAKALSIYMMSSTIGLLIATVGGPWIAENYSWRAAFIAISAPGLIIVGIVLMFLDEPRAQVAAASIEPFGSSLRLLWRKASYRWMVIGVILYFVLAYGAFVFFPSYLVRTHGLSLTQAGAIFGISNAGGGLVGTYLSGVAATRLASKDPRWFLRLPSLFLWACLPVLVGFLTITNIYGLWTTLLLASALTGGALPPIFAALHFVCGSQRRATAVAIMFFFANLLGLGLGPVMTGAASDFLGTGLGEAEGLRISLLATLTLFVPCALALWRAGNRLPDESEG